MKSLRDMTPTLSLATALLAFALPAIALAQLNTILDISYEQAQQLFGGRHAKMIIHYPGPTTPTGGMPGELSLIDFSENPLSLHLVCTDAQTTYGDPFISPDGTRVLYNVNGEIYVRSITGYPQVEKIADWGFDQRWWVHPVTGDEYVIYVDGQINNSDDISGKTYMQKMITGTCKPDGAVRILLQDYAFRGGRTPSGRFLYTNQPGFDFGDLGADSLAVENAHITIIVHGIRMCNASVSQDPAHPDWYLFSNGEHTKIEYSPQHGEINAPQGYYAVQWQEWSTHPDFLTAACSQDTDYYSYTKPGEYDGFVWQWSKAQWTKIAKHSRATHLWVSKCVDNTPPVRDPSNLAAVNVTDTAIQLAWNAAFDPDCGGIQHYTVYRREGQGSFSVAGFTQDTFFVDAVSERANYTYFVTAVNGGDIESGPSNSLAVSSGADVVPPGLSLVMTPDSQHVLVVFTEPVQASGAGDAAHYAIDRGVTVNSVAILAPQAVMLATSGMQADSVYTLSVSGIADCALTPNVLASSVARSFTATLRGRISYEMWQNVSGARVADLLTYPMYPSNPSSVGFLDSLSTPRNCGNEYGMRIRGYLCPTSSGSYTFWISSDDQSQLLFSTSENPDSASIIARVNSWDHVGEWDLDSAQRSSPVALQAGKRYFIEVLFKEALGFDHCDVAWQGPGIAVRTIIAGSFLQPFTAVPYLARAAAPVISPAGASFSDQLTVYITKPNPQSVVRYTTDGSEPAETSPLYANSPLVITQTVTLKARAWQDTLLPSETVTALFQKNSLGRVIFPNGGEHFAIGDTIAMRWTSQDQSLFNSAVLRLSFDGGVSQSPGLSGTSVGLTPGTNMGEFTWVVPDSIGGIALSGQSAILLISQYGGSLVDESDGPFCFGACNLAARPKPARILPPFSITQKSLGRICVQVNTAGPHQLTLVNLLGKTVLERAGVGPQTAVLGDGLAAGVYLVKLTTMEATHRARVMLAR